MLGRRDDALALTGRLAASIDGRYAPAFHLAIAHVGLGDHDEAFRWLERAYLERDPWVAAALNVEPAFQPIRGDPRFDQLIRRMGLVP